jgi:hypothetical protein
MIDKRGTSSAIQRMLVARGLKIDAVEDIF